MVSWKTPTQDQIEQVIDNLKGNLKQQFFAKLENPEWFTPLNEHGLLWYDTNTNDYGSEYKEWIAFPYLLKVASEIPDQVMQLIQPILSDINSTPQTDLWLVQNCVSLATKMPDTQFVKIMTIYAKFVKNADSLGWQDHEVLKKIIERLKFLDKSLALGVCKNILSISLKSNDNASYNRLEPYIKLPNGGYDYNKVLKITYDVFSDSILELLELYISIITKEMIKGLSAEKIEQYYGVEFIRRSAIEKHSQDNYKQEDPIYILVSEIRDIALTILEENISEKIEKVFELLENSTNQTMTRIILHLLRVSNNYDKGLLDKYLTNKTLFDGSPYHYEYYHLIQDKFNELSAEAKNTILEYIEGGPEGEYYEKDENEIWTAQRKKDVWILHKLTPIRYLLSEEISEKYKSILFEDNGQEKQYNEHPDMLYWSESKWGISSPLGGSQIDNKTAEEIVEYLNTWEPNGRGLDSPEVMGLAEVVCKDVTTNPTKYLENLNLFENIKDPTYVHYLLFGLRENDKTTDKQWENLIKFSKWVVAQNQTFESRNRYREGDKDWYGAKSCMAELLSKAFSHKENLSALNDESVSSAFVVLNDLSLTEDRYLEERTKEPEGTSIVDNYLHSAINSLHGKAVEGLVNYTIWLKNNNKPLEPIKPFLEELFNEPPYMETFAIFARMLPWLHHAMPELVEDNLDKLMPEDPTKREIFDVTWITYLDYSRIFDSMFPILEGKFKYVLENKLYASDTTEHGEERRISHHLVIYYARELFDLNSDLLKLIFDIPENSKEQWEFVNHIGFSLWDRNNDNKEQPINKEIIDRFVKFWEWLIEHIKGKEVNYIDALSQFERWYQCSRFENEWVLTQLHNLVMKYDINMQLFMLEDQLLVDLPNFPRKVFDVVSKLTFSKQKIPYYSHKDFLENITKYIKENNFPDDGTLKADKDSFINKYLEKCEAWRVDAETEKFCKYLESAT